MLRQKYVAGTHCHPIYMIIIFTVHNSYSSAWIIHYKMVEGYSGMTFTTPTNHGQPLSRQ